MSGQSQTEARVDDASLRVVSRALNDLVGACMDADSKPKTPDRGALMRARSMLPPYCEHALVHQKNRNGTK